MTWTTNIRYRAARSEYAGWLRQFFLLPQTESDLDLFAFGQTILNLDARQV